MRKCTFPIIAGLIMLLGVFPIGHAQMQSASYRITTSVVSGGGGQMSSSNYRFNGTLGQPSPLIDPAEPPWSSSYDLLTAFWYTVADAAIFYCPADLNLDGSVDEVDLDMLADRFGGTGFDLDADGDLDMDGNDLYEMAKDFNCNDCLEP